MALFKPFRGTRVTLPQELHDGYAYFCTDDGSFHIDFTDADGNLQRKQINAKDAETLTGMTLEEIKAYVTIQPDWNQTDENAIDYVKNRTHWEERNEREVFRIDDLRELEKVYNFVVFPEFLMMKIGYKYRIEINGTFELNGETKTGVFSFEGVCESQAGCDGAVEVRFADDLALLDDMAERASGLYIMYAHSFGKTSVVITEITEIIQKLPMKYLPNGYPYTSFSPIIEQQTIEDFAIMEDPIYAVQNPFIFTPTAGDKYIVHWDGDEYNVDAKEFNGAICIGNENYLYGTTGGDIPFAIFYINGNDVFVATESTDDSHTICIEGEVIHPLDEKFIPETIARKEYVDAQVGDIETTLDSIIAIQNTLIGGDGV